MGKIQNLIITIRKKPHKTSPWKTDCFYEDEVVHENPAGRTAGDDCNLYPSVSV